MSDWAAPLQDEQIRWWPVGRFLRKALTVLVLGQQLARAPIAVLQHRLRQLSPRTRSHILS